VTLMRLPSPLHKGEGHGRRPDPGLGADGASGVEGMERLHGRVRNWGEPPRPAGWLRDAEAGPPITGNGKWWAAGRQSEGVVVLLMGAGDAHRIRREGPLLRPCLEWGYERVNA
jgi:hypothetical protein